MGMYSMSLGKDETTRTHSNPRHVCTTQQSENIGRKSIELEKMTNPQSKLHMIKTLRKLRKRKFPQLDKNI